MSRFRAIDTYRPLLVDFSPLAYVHYGFFFASHSSFQRDAILFRPSRSFQSGFREPSRGGART